MTRRNKFFKKLWEKEKLWEGIDLREMVYDARFEDIIRIILDDEDLKVPFIEYFVEDLVRPLDEE